MAVAQNSWQLAEAKARFSELFRKARTEGPQRVTRSGREAVVILDEAEYQRLTQPPMEEESLADFFARSPLVGLDLDFSHEPDLEREIDL